MNAPGGGRRNLASFLRDLEDRPSEARFVLRTPYRREVWTGPQIRAAAFAVARRLRDGGVVPGDRVLLQGPDSPAWVASLFGIVAAGAVVVPLEAESPVDFAARVAERTSARAVIAPDAGHAGLTGGVGLRMSIAQVERGRDEPAGSFEVVEARPEDTAEIVFTSGTTAEPKGVELTHRNILASLEGIEAGFRRRRRWLAPLLPFRFFCVLPLSHLFGQSLGIFVPILMRSTSVFPSTLQPARLVAWTRRERPVAIITVPRVLAVLRAAVTGEIERAGGRERIDRALARSAGRGVLRRALAAWPVRRALGLRTWVLVSGGAALDPDVEAYWRGCGFLVIQGYGMTEAAPVISVQNPLDGSVRTLGRPIRDVEVRIADDGEVLVRGPNVMKGYWKDPEATRTALTDGWLHTGDLAERDAAGRLTFRGRKKELIVPPGGKNVYPSDVEAALRSLGAVRDAVAFALPGEAGDEVHAAVLLADPAADVGAIRSAANAQLLPYQAIRRVIPWDGPDFPRTSTGKVRRLEVAAVARALQAGGEAHPAAPAPAGGGGVAAALARIRGGLAGPAEERARLAQDLGLDSLDLLELVGILEAEAGVSVADEALRGDLTIADLERLTAPAQAGADAPPRPLTMTMTRWNRSLPVRLLRNCAWSLVLRPLFSVFVRLEVAGRERVQPVAGPFLVVANHASMFDAPAVRAALPRHLGRRLYPAMAVETLPAHFEPGRHSLGERIGATAQYVIASALFGAYPMPQSRGFRPSLEYTGELLDAGLSPLVFPEGRMSRDGRPLPFKTGIGLLAVETRAWVLPVRLSGLNALLPPDARWPRRGRASAVIGTPFQPGADGADPATVARRIETAVRDLGA